MAGESGSQFKRCFACAYSLRGHKGQDAFACPECGVAYDQQTLFWRTPRDLLPFRTSGRAVAFYWCGVVPVVAGIIAVLAYKSLDLAARVLVIATPPIMVVRWILRRRRDRSISYIASGPDGLVVSVTGKPRQFEIVPWSAVRKKLDTVGSGWAYAGGVASDLGVSLGADDAVELMRQLQERTRDLNRGD